MSDGGNPVGAFVSFWMFLQLLGVLTSLMGGIYALFCLSRMANGVNRLADATEKMAQLQETQLTAQREMPRAQPFVPVSPPLSPAPISPVETVQSSTQIAPSPTFTEHDVRPRSDSF